MILIFLCILFFLLPYIPLIFILSLSHKIHFLSSILQICLYQCFNVFIKVHNIRFQTESMPIIKKKWQTKFVTGEFAGSFDWLVKTNSNGNIVRYKKVCAGCRVHSHQRLFGRWSYLKRVCQSLILQVVLQYGKFSFNLELTDRETSTYSHLRRGSVLFYNGHSFLSQLTVLKFLFVLSSLQHGHLPIIK